MTTAAAPFGHATPPVLANSRTPIDGDEAARVDARRLAWRGRYAVDSDDDLFQFEQLVAQSVRLERCQERRRALEAYEAIRAATHWAADRKAEAEALGAGLGRRPAVVAAQLESSKAGCDWLIARWDALGRALDAKGTWTDPQRKLAADLLGTPREVRELEPGLPGESPAALVARERARLERLKVDGLDHIDDLERRAATAGLPMRTSREWDRLKREEDDAQRRYDRARSRLRVAPAPDVHVPAATAVPPAPPDDAPPARPPKRPRPAFPIAVDDTDLDDLDGLDNLDDLLSDDLARVADRARSIGAARGRAAVRSR